MTTRAQNYDRALSMHHRGCPVVVSRCAATNAWIWCQPCPKRPEAKLSPRPSLLVPLAARCRPLPTMIGVEFVSLVRGLDESREEFLRGSPLRSTSTTARRKGYVHGRGCLEGAWSSTRPQRELRGVRARPALSRCGGRETSRFDEGRTESCPTAQRKRFAALQLV